MLAGDWAQGQLIGYLIGRCVCVCVCWGRWYNFFGSGLGSIYCDYFGGGATILAVEGFHSAAVSIQVCVVECGWLCVCVSVRSRFAFSDIGLAANVAK